MNECSCPQIKCIIPTVSCVSHPARRPVELMGLYFLHKMIWNHVNWTTGLSIVGSVYGGTAVLHRLLPGRHVIGYACDADGQPLRYKLNGLFVLIVMGCIWGLLGSYDVVPWSYIHLHLLDAAMVANMIGWIGTIVLWIRAKWWNPTVQVPVSTRQCPTKRVASNDKWHQHRPSFQEVDHQIASRSWLSQLYFGLEWNPRMFSIDLKIYGYMVGAIQLVLNVWSGVAYEMSLLQKQQQQHYSGYRAILVYAMCMTWFGVEYLYWEEPHLYTYDFFAERYGFKLWWGCTTFYPFFYAIGGWGGVFLRTGEDQDLSAIQACSCIALYLVGWMLTRGANLQKYAFKRDPSVKSVRLCWGLMSLSQETIPGSGILCNGFWGLSRHINYLGEILQSIAVSLPGVWTSGSFLPLLYVLYYLGLLIPRQWDDERICLEKYGSKWYEYQRRVPYRIVPGVY